MLQATQSRVGFFLLAPGVEGILLTKCLPVNRLGFSPTCFLPLLSVSIGAPYNNDLTIEIKN
jgi:hypothetical protein